MSDRTCAVDGCGSRHYCKGYCNLHYSRMRTKGTTDDPIRKHPPRLRKGDDRSLTKTCPSCGEQFTIERGRGISNKKYCSRACWRPAISNPDNPLCPEVDGGKVCGLPWRTPGVPLCATHYQRKLKYGGTDLRRRVPTGSCLQCDKPLPSPKHRFYCSEECGYLNRTGYEPKEIRECRGCGSVLDTEASRKKIYCNDKCRGIIRRFQQYGASLAVARQMRNITNCQICGSDGELAVDHCHDSRRIRGVLCHQCNVGIGMFRDNEELLDRAIEYLRR